MREPKQPNWRRYLRLFGPRAAADLDDELRFHIEMRVADYMARGLTEAEARAATAQRLGDMAAARQTCEAIAQKRDNRMRRTQLLDAFTQDVSFALRTLGRQKAWTAVAVLTLSLGIGVNSAMFSVLNHLLLHPLPYPGSSRVALVSQMPSQGNRTGMNVAMLALGRQAKAWREDSRSFEDLQAYDASETSVTRAGEAPFSLHYSRVLPGFAAFTGERPLRGRMFTEDEARQNSGVVLISERMWRARYGAQDDVLGKTLTAFERPQTIIGVMPATFQLPRVLEDETDLWVPLDLVRADDDGVQMIGRLRSGVSYETAAVELDSIAARRGVKSKDANYGIVVASAADYVSIKDSLALMAAAVALVLLIACSNVAHLLLARGSARQREMAIRAALGAGAGRIFRQLVTESVLLSAAGGAGGLLLGWVGLKAMIATRPNSLSVLSAARMDGWTLGITMLIAVATALAFGVIGGVQASRHATSHALKDGAAASSTGAASRRARGLLVITEMALCTMLLIGAALLIRSIAWLNGRDAGFDPKGLYAVSVQLPNTRYANPQAKQRFYRQLQEAAARVPGVAGATVAGAAPMTQAFMIGALQAEGAPDPEKGTTGFIAYNGVDPDYFRLMRMRLLRGGTYSDTTNAAAQGIVNESMERQLWPGQSGLGKRLRVVYGGQGQWRTVVGVVTDALNRGRTDRGSPMLYTPGATFTKTLLIRASDPERGAAVARQVADLAAAADTRLPPPYIEDIDSLLSRSIARPRFIMLLLSLFAAVAAGLAAVGLYGVLAYLVSQRTREIGIRMALGASRQAVGRSVLSQGMVLAGVGAALGLTGALWGSRLLTTLLYGVKQTDPASFVAGGVALLVIAAGACLVPMRRALAVDPIIAIRAD